MTFNGKQSATDWIDVPSILTGTWGIKYRVVNGQLTLIVNGAASIPDSSTATTLSTAPLPADYCPPTTARVGGYFAGFPGNVWVTASGDVQAMQQTGAARTSVASTISYPVA